MSLNLKNSHWTIKTIILILFPYTLASLYLNDKSVLGLGLINIIGFAYPVYILSDVKLAKKHQDFLIGLYSILSFIAIWVLLQVVLYSIWKLNVVYSLLLTFDILVFSVALTFESKS